MSQGRQPELPAVIHSPANSTLKLIRALRQRKRRQVERAFIIEGKRAVRDAIAAGGPPHVLLLRDDLGGLDLEEFQAIAGAAQTRIVSHHLFDAVAETESPQGVLGVFAMPDLPLPAGPTPLYLILDQIRDPGNMGTLLRSAAGAGVSAVLLTPACVDPFNDKAVRAGVGAHFRVPIHQLTPVLRSSLTETLLLRIVADAGANLTYDEVDWQQGAALIVGSEAAGISAEMIEFATDRVRIPLAAGIESLNAAIAGSVILYEAARQRRVGL